MGLQRTHMRRQTPEPITTVSKQDIKLLLQMKRGTVIRV